LKDQCLRLEETLRGEIKAWKDQFLCIDAEHTRLLVTSHCPSKSVSTSPSIETILWPPGQYILVPCACSMNEWVLLRNLTFGQKLLQAVSQ
jgi:hypothetical protein